MDKNTNVKVMDVLNGELCEKLAELNKRKRGVNANVRTDVDLVEKDYLLRKIRAERREANKELAELSLKKSVTLYDATKDEAEPDDEKDEDAEEVAAADIQELEEENADEYNAEKIDIETRKMKLAELIKDATNPLMADSEKRANDVKIKAKLRSICEQVNVYKMYNRDIMICGHSEVEDFQANLYEIMYLSTETACEYEAAKHLENKVNESANYSFIKNFNIDLYDPVGSDRFIKYKAFVDL